MEQHQKIDSLHYFHTLLYFLRILLKYIYILVPLVTITAAFLTYDQLRKPILYQTTVSTLALSEGGSVSPLSYLQKLGIMVTSGGLGDTASLIGSIIYSRRMAKDIVKKFGKSPVSLTTYATGPMFTIKVIADDPKLAVNVANFCVVNVDKINNELDISPTKPLLKILDPAENAIPLPRPIARKVLFPTLFVGLVGCSLAILLDYIKTKKLIK